MYRHRVSEEITAPIWETHLEARRADGEATTGMRPRPIAAALDEPPPSLLEDPALVLAGASALGLLATGLAAALGFLVGVLVA
jgi:hypothetical protein